MDPFALRQADQIMGNQLQESKFDGFGCVESTPRLQTKPVPPAGPSTNTRHIETRAAFTAPPASPAEEISVPSVPSVVHESALKYTPAHLPCSATSPEQIK